MTKMKHKAVIQTNKVTGVCRVFYRKKINGVTRIVETSSANLFRYSVTGYHNLPNILVNLTDCMSVGVDECVMFMGENVDEILGLAPKQNQTNKIMENRKKILEEFNMTEQEIINLFSEAA